jgi:hypothetical protein
MERVAATPMETDTRDDFAALDPSGGTGRVAEQRQISTPAATYLNTIMDDETFSILDWRAPRRI